MTMRPLTKAAAVGLALVLGACASGGAGGPGAAAPFVATAVDGVQRVTVVGGSYFFSPSHLVVRANVPVELTLLKEGGVVPHEFILSAPEAGIAVAESLSSDPKVVRFTPTRPGTYPFFCGKKLPFFPSHREKGMAGVLEVLP